MESKRCFIALDLPREIINEIEKIQKLVWKENLFAGKLTESENLHLTLKFLGEIDDDLAERVKERLREVKFNSFSAELGKVGVFSKKFVRIIWIELKNVFDLQKVIDDKLKDLFEPENRFMSHITIARVKHVKNKEKLISYVEGMKPKKSKFKVDKFFLKKSELLPEGPVYEDLEEYRLQK